MEDWRDAIDERDEAYGLFYVRAELTVAPKFIYATWIRTSDPLTTVAGPAWSIQGVQDR